MPCLHMCVSCRVRQAELKQKSAVADVEKVQYELQTARNQVEYLRKQVRSRHEFA